MSYVDWSHDVDRACAIFRADRNEPHLRQCLERLGLADHEIDGHVEAEKYQRPADGPLQPSRIRQQGAR